jgi:hypothetical protein
MKRRKSLPPPLLAKPWSVLPVKPCKEWVEEESRTRSVSTIATTIISGA